MTLIKMRQPKYDAPEIAFEREYRDRITGFVGICTGFCRYVSGCDQVLLQPKVGPDNKKAEGVWFDDERLIDVEREASVRRTSRRGGPQESEAPVR